MTKLVVTFGIIAGLIVTALMFANKPLWIDENGQYDMQLGEILGYVSMIIALSVIFFGIRSFRDNHLNGQITFGGAFKIGLLITLVASAIYVIQWMIYYSVSPEAQDFAEQYMNAQIEQMEAANVPADEIAKTKKEFEQGIEYYNNNWAVRAGMTLMEIFPVGLVITLISSLILKNKNSNS